MNATLLEYGTLRRNIEKYVEDPLADHSRASSEACDSILIEAVKCESGEIKHLKFQGLVGATNNRQPAVDAAARNTG